LQPRPRGSGRRSRGTADAPREARAGGGLIAAQASELRRNLVNNRLSTACPGLVYQCDASARVRSTSAARLAASEASRALARVSSASISKRRPPLCRASTRASSVSSRCGAWLALTELRLCQEANCPRCSSETDARSVAIESAREPLVAVDVDLDREREPGLQFDVDEAELTVHEVVVELQAGVSGISCLSQRQEVATRSPTDRRGRPPRSGDRARSHRA